MNNYNIEFIYLNNYIYIYYIFLFFFKVYIDIDKIFLIDFFFSLYI